MFYKTGDDKMKVTYRIIFDNNHEFEITFTGSKKEDLRNEIEKIRIGFIGLIAFESEKWFL